VDEENRAGEGERCPRRIADQRAKLHEQRGPEATRQPTP